MIKREMYMQRIRPFINTDLVKVMTGIRRCGKSVMLELIKEELKNIGISDLQFLSFNFEDMRNSHLCTAQALHDEVIQRTRNLSGKIYLFFDEIQEVEHWEKCINSFRLELDCDIYITGSNAFLLSSDLATLFTGRTFEIKVYPFSFSEYMKYFGLKDRYDALDKYVLEGGMSGSYLYKDQEAKYDYIADVFDTLIVRDIRKKYKIRNTQLMDRIVDFLMDNVSNLSSARNITNTLGSMQEKIHHTTVGNYMQYLCNAFAFYKVRRYDIKGKKYLSSNDKYYLSDHTFRYAKLGTKNMDYGRILENIVAIELLRRGYEVYVGILYKKEIDFVAVKRSEKIYIQVSDNISEEKTFEREVAPLLQIKDAYPKYVIARTRHDEYQYEGIKVIDIADWLLDK